MAYWAQAAGQDAGHLNTGGFAKKNPQTGCGRQANFRVVPQRQRTLSLLVQIML